MCVFVCVCVGRRIINCFQCTHACLYALIYPKPGSVLCKIYTYTMYVYNIYIYIHICLIRAFKNNTIHCCCFFWLCKCVCVCVLYLKHAQQLKVFFTQIEFAPRTLPPLHSRQSLLLLLLLLLLPSQLTSLSPSSLLLLALPILLPVIGRCH